MSSRILSFTLFAFAFLAVFAQAASIRLASGPLVACKFAKLRFEGLQAPVVLTIEDSHVGTVEELRLMSESGVGWFVSTHTEPDFV